MSTAQPRPGRPQGKRSASTGAIAARSSKSDSVCRTVSADVYHPHHHDGDDEGGDKVADGASKHVFFERELGKQGEPELDIEHVLVANDPRKWSWRKKHWVLFVISLASICSSLAANIYFPAIAQIQAELDMSNQMLSLTVSLYIFFQGSIPILWSALAEIFGRKPIYLISFGIFIAGSIVCALATNDVEFLIMRIVAASGSSSVLALGAGSLADVFESEVRGRKLGIYYMAPLIGPSLGSLIGGALTSASSWRATFYFLIGYAGVSLIVLAFFPETYRKERSLAWLTAMKQAQKHAQKRSARTTPATSIDLPRPPSAVRQANPVLSETDVKAIMTPPEARSASETSSTTVHEEVITKEDIEASTDQPIRLGLRDVNPLSAVGEVMRRPSNAIALIFSGLLFGAQYSLSYTAAKSFSAAPYSLSAIQIGLVLLAFGVGNIVGSVGGGRYSDYVLRRLKDKAGGKGVPEMRIRSTLIAMPILPISFLAYAWAVQYHRSLAGCVVILFIQGVACIWIYSSVLAYAVDNNKGRAASAVACNSVCRGTFGFLLSEIATPITDRIGNGWYYTIIAVCLALGEAALLLILWKGAAWRIREGAREERKKAKEAEHL
ncbi:uncharacterized protein L969DRAFT_70268 [Mixia osmundae IAM 14324]|uniref:Major facilitator superfamily (MFS) profile domain-containing protein n=1 Tax=Mixia osmundae (strain CBS 9802 / IAM 14324 / JCM 22182 / KY 12970) TaxID=764103 RepID=G7DTG7_MIXOS|nr:uncharacterized protein L969DRAFT_70268 [Mixia osmundae IAM 14324]KEI42848.1 hypothetical protein L969DRAFT_70268 [Mixia osmundae IAM 14324]GAA93814.1 hypothetical protein E5Q_00460 [Mixia osmundae IAM 14324]